MDTPMSDAEIREALARAERATCSCHIEITRVHGFPQGHRSDCARTDVPRLAADLLAARAERDLALSLRNTATNVLADVVAHRDSLAARCRELEGFLRGLLHASSGTRDKNAAALLSRLETRAQVLLSPPSPHTCQIHRATSGASDCGLSPCEEAQVHRDRGAARPTETATAHGPYCPKNPDATIRHMVDFCTCGPTSAGAATPEDEKVCDTCHGEPAKDCGCAPEYCSPENHACPDCGGDA